MSDHHKARGASRAPVDIQSIALAVYVLVGDSVNDSEFDDHVTAAIAAHATR
ncbi:hypothetical protein [uncultured Cellulomonas sp.]|uniref:hypothetical protein n=1 Tax=uncultured Cellulomonas sp. TaxID=189682 RepID=UPI00262FE215|nr:hypothetical protein [uncultured Cellulomonas sp.]